MIPRDGLLCGISHIKRYSFNYFFQMINIAVMWLHFYLAICPINEAAALPSGETCEVRGFLIKNPEGVAFLVESPDVKSCCLGKKKGVEMRLDGDLFKDPLPLHAVAVQGTIDRVENQIVLRNPQLMESKSAGWGWMLGTVLGVGLIFGWRRMRGS